MSSEGCSSRCIPLEIFPSFLGGVTPMGVIPRGTEIWLATAVPLAFLLSFQSPLKRPLWMLLCEDSGPVTLLKPRRSLLNPKVMPASGLEAFQRGIGWHSMVTQLTTTGLVFILRGLYFEGNDRFIIFPPIFACPVVPPVCCPARRLQDG